MNYFMTPTLGDQKIGNFFLPILSKGLWAKYSKPKNRFKHCKNCESCPTQVTWKIKF